MTQCHNFNLGVVARHVGTNKIRKFSKLYKNSSSKFKKVIICISVSKIFLHASVHCCQHEIIVTYIITVLEFQTSICSITIDNLAYVYTTFLARNYLRCKLFNFKTLRCASPCIYMHVHTCTHVYTNTLMLRERCVW
jgi:hypothetical protein